MSVVGREALRLTVGGPGRASRLLGAHHSAETCLTTRRPLCLLAPALARLLTRVRPFCLQSLRRRAGCGFVRANRGPAPATASPPSPPLANVSVAATAWRAAHLTTPALSRPASVFCSTFLPRPGSPCPVGSITAPRLFYSSLQFQSWALQVCF